MSDSFVSRYNIGIDVGGTNTDGVLYDCIEKKIAATVKMATVHASYAKAIEGALESLIGSCGMNSTEIASLNISTTVSTNALLEDKIEQTNLILIGFERYPHIISDIEKTIRPLSVFKVRGGHNGWGKERECFDHEAVVNFAKSRIGELFTVSSFYSSRNPEHEITAKEILLSNGSGHVTCGHELSYSKLNAVKRTVTAYLNTSLVPVTGRLIDDLRSVSRKFKLSCPIMFLKSDSTLVPAEWCRRFPIEMIYSGPAASLRGAYYITEGDQQSSFIVADIGGTSTDIGRIEKGRAVSSEEGAKVGSYKTMIPSLDIMSIALGGDSRVEIYETKEISVGPKRSVPLCRASEALNISADFLLDYLKREYRSEGPLVQPLNSRNESSHLLGHIDCRLPEKEPSQPQSGATNVFAMEKWPGKEFSYTPTDAFNTLGLSEVGEVGISEAASLIIGTQCGMGSSDLAKKTLLKANSMLEYSINEYTSQCGLLPRVYVGMPAKVFAKLGKNKDIKIAVQQNGGVAGAVGAAVSSMELSCRVFIMHSFSDESFTAFLPETTRSSNNYQELSDGAVEAGKRYLRKLAERMGYHADTIEVVRSFSYVGDVENIASLLSVSIECRAIVDHAQ
jgi:N-methylhydantoinase A/oxoprolinase/acetone carboxylase beta subunit